MRNRWQKFLVASMLYAAGILPACTVEVVEGPPSGVGGTAGSAGTGGSGGAPRDAASEDGTTPDAPESDGASADAAGSDTTADTTSADTADGAAGDVSNVPDASPDAADASTADIPADTPAPDGGSPDAVADAGGGCFAEDLPDAGSANDCSTLPYYNVFCADDAGSGFPPAGATLCDSLEADLKTSAFRELYACLTALPGADGGMDACSSAHEQGSADCSRAIFNRSTCPVPDGVAEGGLYGCAQIAASCGPDSGDGGVSVELCQSWLGPFNATTRQEIIDCYLDPTDVGATSCRDKLENYCVFR